MLRRSRNESAVDERAGNGSPASIFLAGLLLSATGSDHAFCHSAINDSGLVKPHTDLESRLNQPFYLRLTHKGLTLIAVLFGVVTIFAGSGVLTGSDPGYVVFFPLLVYNTVMGFIYIGVGVVAWRNVHYGRNGAAAVFVLNLLVLVAIWLLYNSGGAVAIDSLRAMTLRTIIWLLLFTGLFWLSRRNPGT